MPTSITVPLAQRVKSIQFGAQYSPSLTFNPDKDLFFNCSGVLFGMDITLDTGPTPDEITVSPGAFIQNGIIVNITNSQLVQVPEPASFPVYLVAENANETFNSTVTIQFTTSPNADSVIIAEWDAAAVTYADFVQPLNISVCALRDEIELINKRVINRDRQVAAGGQTVFTLPAGKEYELGANKIWVFRNGKKIDDTVDYNETDPNTITLLFPAIAGDIFEFMIYQSEPPVTSIALNNLTDVISDLAAGIRDDSVLRAALATAANPLATIADITTAVGAIPPPAVGNFQFHKWSSPVGTTGVSGAVIVPGTQVPFTLTAPRDVKISMTSGGFVHSSNGSSGLAYIRVNGVDHQIGDVRGSNGGGFLLETAQASGFVIVNLPAGPHTAEVFGTGGGNPSILGPIQVDVATSEVI